MSTAQHPSAPPADRTEGRHPARGARPSWRPLEMIPVCLLEPFEAERLPWARWLARAAPPSSRRPRRAQAARRCRCSRPAPGMVPTCGADSAGALGSHDRGSSRTGSRREAGRSTAKVSCRSMPPSSSSVPALVLRIDTRKPTRFARLTSSPSASWVTARIDTRLTHVPLADPRSSIVTRSSLMVSTAWRREIAPSPSISPPRPSSRPRSAATSSTRPASGPSVHTIVALRLARLSIGRMATPPSRKIRSTSGPIDSTSRCRMGKRLTRCPFRNVPLRLPRSSTKYSVPLFTICACRLETVRESILS